MKLFDFNPYLKRGYRKALKRNVKASCAVEKEPNERNSSRVKRPIVSRAKA